MSDLLTYLQTNEPQFRKTRLAALYSDFRHLRTTNSDGYTANIQAWTSALSSAALAGVIPSTVGHQPDLLSLNVGPALLQALETKEWGRPLALGTVVREAVAKKEWMFEREFRDSQESVYARSWRIRPWDVVSWGLRQLGLAGGVSGEDKVVVGKVVVLANLEVAGKEVGKRIEGQRGRVERVYTRAEFTERFADVVGEEKRLSDSDMVTLLRFLSRDKGILVYDAETVKFLLPSDSSPTITQEDTTIASLKTLINGLNVQTITLTKKVDELNLAAKTAVERKNRVAALSALRSKKLAESTLSKRHATLAQLEEVFAKIEQAADQVELVRIMEASTKVLTGLNKEVGGVERVDSVVDQLREQMDSVDEVGNVIAEPGKVDVVGEAEVDEELEAMEKEERVKREAEGRKEKEEKESMEAEETRKRLDALSQSEKESRESAARQETETKSQEKGVEESAQGVKKLSLMEDAHRIPV